MKRLAYAAESFQRRHGRWPTVAEIVAADVTLPARDPWQHDYVLDLDRGGMLTVCSAGIDGRTATGDDIRSPTICAAD